MTYSQISTVLGISKSSVSYYLNEVENKRARSNLSRKEIAKTIRQFKENMGCMDCQEKHPHYILEFDHRPDTEKLGNIHAVLVAYGAQKAWEEIDKCDVVCANCHKKRTYERKPWGDID